MPIRITRTNVIVIKFVYHIMAAVWKATFPWRETMNNIIEISAVRS